jgi:hypothetical protein
MARGKRQGPPQEPKRLVFETFRQPSHFLLRGLEQAAYDVFNREVHVRRWRITVETIEETDDVIYARLLDLWERSANFHEWEPLRDAAKALGRELPSDRLGKRREKK